MEKLILACGRYAPMTVGDTESRVRAVEAYLSRLTEELELLVEEMDKTLDALEALIIQRDGIQTASVQYDGEGGE
jgi:pilus assembly protein TadC